MSAAGMFVVLAVSARGEGFGQDNRRPLPEGKAYDWVGRVLVNGSYGSGCLIGPDSFLTAAHAVVDGDKDEVYPDWKVEFGWHPNEAHQEAHVREVTWTHHWDKDPASGQDWALVRLDKPVGQQFGWVGVRNFSNYQMLRIPIEFVGFASNPDENQAQFKDCAAPYISSGRIRAISPRIIHFDCAIWGGSSGGALIAWEQQTPYLVGLVSASVSIDGEKVENGFKVEAARFPDDYWTGGGNVGVPTRSFFATLEAAIPANRSRAQRPSPYRIGGRSLGDSNTSKLALAVGDRLLVQGTDGQAWTCSIRGALGEPRRVQGSVELGSVRFVVAADELVVTIDEEGKAQGFKLYGDNLGNGYSLSDQPLFDKANPPSNAFVAGGRLMLSWPNGTLQARDLGARLGPPLPVTGGFALNWGTPPRFVVPVGNRLVLIGDSGEVSVQTLGRSLGSPVYLPGPPVAFSTGKARFVFALGNRLMAVSQEGELWAFGL